MQSAVMSAGQPDDLYRFFRDNIPRRVSAFMDELESFANSPLSFGLRTDGTNQMSTHMAPAGATILIPTAQFEDPSQFNEHSACHELIHVHRYWREGVPKVNSHFPRDNELVGFMNNQKEHICMAPMEQVFGYDPVWFQDNITNEFIAFLKGHTKTEAYGHQSRMYLFLMSKEITSGPTYKLLCKMAKKRGLGNLIDNATRCGEIVKKDTRSACRKFFSEFDLDRSNAWFYTFDIRNKAMLREWV